MCGSRNYPYTHPKGSSLDVLRGKEFLNLKLISSKRSNIQDYQKQIHGQLVAELHSNHFIVLPPHSALMTTLLI